MATATNGERCDVDQDVCATVVAVAGQPLDAPPTMAELELVRQRVRHEGAPNSCKNHWSANRTPTICGPYAAEGPKCANDGDEDDDGGQNGRWA